MDSYLFLDEIIRIIQTYFRCQARVLESGPRKTKQMSIRSALFHEEEAPIRRVTYQKYWFGNLTTTDKNYPDHQV